MTSFVVGLLLFTARILSFAVCLCSPIGRPACDASGQAAQERCARGRCTDGKPPWQAARGDGQRERVAAAAGVKEEDSADSPCRFGGGRRRGDIAEGAGDRHLASAAGAGLGALEAAEAADAAEAAEAAATPPVRTRAGGEACNSGALLHGLGLPAARAMGRP